MQIILLDTGCIDLLLNRKGGGLTDFQKIIKDHEQYGNSVGTTAINCGERRSGLKAWEDQEYVKEDTKYLWRKILEFFVIVESRNMLFSPSNKTAEIYADLHYKMKSDKENNVQKGELKNMHNDLWIASICIENSAKLYTNDKRDMSKIKNIEPSLDIEYIQK